MLEDESKILQVLPDRGSLVVVRIVESTSFPVGLIRCTLGRPALELYPLIEHLLQPCLSVFASSTCCADTCGNEGVLAEAQPLSFGLQK